MNHEFEKLNEDERKQFDSLARQCRVPDTLEDKVVDALKEESLINSPKTKTKGFFSRFNPVFASVLGLVTIGIAVLGVWYFAVSSPNSDKPQFILFLRESPEIAKSELSEKEFDQLSEAYAEWTDLNRQNGILKEGDNLEDEVRILDKVDERDVVLDKKEDPNEDLIIGWFIIRARDLDEAVKVAKTCPFYKYGRIEVRQIEDPRLN